METKKILLLTMEKNTNKINNNKCNSQIPWEINNSYLLCNINMLNQIPISKLTI